jgi:ATP-dependent Clp protease adapter protein ClpS
MKYIQVILYSLLAIYIVGCGGGSTNTTNVSKELSFWAWDGVESYESAVSKLSSEYGVPTIYLNPVDHSEYRFVENSEYLASKSVKKEWFLMSGGDDVYPTMEYVEEQANKILDYNNNHTTKIVGMALDVEPWIYFEDQNSTDNQDDWQEYLDFMAQARDILHQNGLKISIAIPFWIDRQTASFPNDRPINYDVIDIADEIIVMTYTVYKDRIESYAKSSLEYASSKGIDIKIALEMDKNDNDEVSFYNHPEDIKGILNMPLDYSTFKGYIIHTLDSFDTSGIEL